MNKVDGSTTKQGWACSCMNFTRHTPRTECKHILKVMMESGVKVDKAKAAVANMDADEAAQYAEFKRQQEAAKKQKPTAGDADLALFGQTGRKFR